MFKVRASFIGNFKIGDNIHHSLRTMGLLYRYFEEGTPDEKRLLCKPITILLVSIIEVVLHDFHSRIRSYKKEGVSSLTEDVITDVRSKDYNDELGKYIVSARKHDFFDLGDTNFYDVLDILRKLRNRIHIQNTKNDFEPDEYTAFSEKRKKQAEKVLEIMLKTMAEKHSRNIDVTSYVNDFELPWSEYFTHV